MITDTNELKNATLVQLIADFKHKRNLTQI